MSHDTISRAIIIAAGKGSRLEHHTDECCKCMVEVGGQSILSHQLHALAESDIDDLHIIRGYLAETLRVDGATYYLNDDFENNNILASLFYAKEAMDQPFVSTYSDIVYTPQVVRTLLSTPGDIVLVVDRKWSDAYVGRDDHPVEQAELCEVDDAGKVRCVGKQVGPSNALGEFIGLAKYSAKGAKVLREVYEEVAQTHGPNDPFHAAAKFRKAYLTDLFLELIARNVELNVAAIDGGWREIDTVQDLERVNNSDWT